MIQLTDFQIQAVIDWMNTWDQLKGTAIPIRFKEDFGNGNVKPITIPQAIGLYTVLKEKDVESMELFYKQQKAELIKAVNEKIARRINDLINADGWISLGSFREKYASPEIRQEAWAEYEVNGILLNLVFITRAGHQLYGKLKGKEGDQIPYIGPEFNEITYSDFPISFAKPPEPEKKTILQQIFK